MTPLLDKWQRLLKSEYLRADEKLMLNHCIADLKRYIESHNFQIVQATVNKKTIYRLYLNQNLHSEHDDREHALYTQIKIQNSLFISGE